MMTTQKQTQIPSPNLDMAREHLRATFGILLQSEKKLLFAVASGEGKPLGAQTYQLSEAGIEAAVAWCAAENARGRDVYFRGAAIRGDWLVRNPNNAKGKPRRDSEINDGDVAGAAAVWIDCDEPQHFAPFRDPKRASGFPPPSFHVVTGTQPSLRRHSYWRLGAPLTPEPHWKPLSEDLSAYFGSDKSVTNPSTYLRLAGFVSYPKANKEGRVAELVRLETPENASPIVTLKNMQDAFSGAEMRAERAKQSANVVSKGDQYWRGQPVNLNAERGRAFDEVLELLRAGKEDGAWHENTRSAVATMLGWGYDDHAIHAIVAAHGRADNGVGDADVQRLIDGGRRRWDLPHTEPGAERESGRFKVHRDYAVDRSCNYLVKGLLDRNTLAVTFGGPKAGKTFVMLDIALHIAQGAGWQGMKTKPARVIYNCAEGGDKFGNRIHAALGGAPMPQNFGYINTGVVYDDGYDFAEIVEEMRRENGCDLLVIDTVARSMGGDENLAKDMNAFVRALDALRAEFGCTVLGVHHSGKDETKGGRGSNALLGAVNTELAVVKKHGFARVLKTTAQRDNGETEIDLDLEVFDLGLDAEGDAISTLRVKPFGRFGKPPVRDRREPITGVKRQVFDSLVEYAGAGHGRLNPGGPGWPAAATVHTVDRELFRAFVMGRLTGEKESNRRAANRAISQLIDLGYVGSNDDCVWPIIKGEPKNVE